MNKQKITLNLWFSSPDGAMLPVLEYYTNIFGDQFSHQDVVDLGETPGGRCQMCEVKLYGIEYLMMATPNPHHTLNDSCSLAITCDNQAEIDKFWNYFTTDGQESQCGWCQDKYGLRWQIIPHNLNELVSKPDGMDVMMGQTKIVINEYGF